MRASQLHKLNVHGTTSDFQFAVSIKSLTQHGTDAIVAHDERCSVQCKKLGQRVAQLAKKLAKGSVFLIAMSIL